MVLVCRPLVAYRVEDVEELYGNGSGYDGQWRHNDFGHSRESQREWFVKEGFSGIEGNREYCGVRRPNHESLVGEHDNNQPVRLR